MQGNPTRERHKNRDGGRRPPLAASKRRSGLNSANKTIAICRNSAQGHPAFGAEPNDDRRDPMQRSKFAGLLRRLASGAGMMAIGLSILAASPASAAEGQCRSVKSDKDRLACFDREAPSAHSFGEARPATDQKIEGGFIDPVEWLKSENDKVATRLKGICRGC